MYSPQTEAARCMSTHTLCSMNTAVRFLIRMTSWWCSSILFLRYSIRNAPESQYVFHSVITLISDNTHITQQVHAAIPVSIYRRLLRCAGMHMYNMCSEDGTLDAHIQRISWQNAGRQIDRYSVRSLVVSMSTSAPDSPFICGWQVNKKNEYV